jgi:hypothetical protein
MIAQRGYPIGEEQRSPGGQGEAAGEEIRWFEVG